MFRESMFFFFNNLIFEKFSLLYINMCICIFEKFSSKIIYINLYNQITIYVFVAFKYRICILFCVKILQKLKKD